MGAPAVDDAAQVLADPLAYTDETRLHAALAHLRAEEPVAFVDASAYRPSWAITKHADVTAIERANGLFINGPRPVLMRAEYEDLQAQSHVSTLIHMDDPQHRKVRAIGTDWFRPKAMRALKVRVDELAKIHVDKLRDAGGECDFVQEVAVNYPLFVIMSLLGVPEADFPRMLKLTQELVGNEDSEFQRSATPQEQVCALLDMFEYFSALTAARREHPTEDFASAIANACIDREPLSDIDTASYYVIIATAGHDTTSATIGGGMRALIENLDQRKRLQANMNLMPSATEEMIRWVMHDGRPFNLGPQGSTMEVYGATKAALNRITSGLAAELQGTGLRVNAVGPRVAVMSEGFAERLGDLLGPGSIESREEIVEAVVALCHCPADVTGRVAVSLDLIRDSGLTVHGFNGLANDAHTARPTS